MDPTKLLTHGSASAFVCAIIIRIDFGIAPGLAQPHCHLGSAHAIVYGQATTSIIIIVCTYKCIHIPYCPVIREPRYLEYYFVGRSYFIITES